MQLGTKIALGVAAGLGLYLATRKASAAEPPVEPTPPDPGTPGTPGTPVTPPEQAVGAILQTVGKHWVLTNKIASNGKSGNYGWHFKGATFGGQKFEASVSLPGVRVIQGVGTAHDRFHADYSQTCVLASQACIYQGQERVLSDLLVDPEASKLLSVEGPLQITRQPGVPQLEPLNILSGSGPVISRAEVAALPDNLTKREAILLGWVEQGSAEIGWASIATGDLTFYVFGDALMFGGVRVNASATLLQQIADRLSCSLLTPRMADLVFASATRTILPIPLGASPQMASTAWMLNESDKITAAAAG